MNDVQKLKQELKEYVNPEKAAFFPRFFKTGKGQYGEGDKFIGVTVPDQRKVARKFINVDLSVIQDLLNDEIHEYRLTGLLILVMKYQKAKLEKEQAQIVDFYLKNLDRVNNWDLVDSSAGYILGDYLLERPREQLYLLAKSGKLWHERVAIIATQAFIKNNDFEDTIKISKLLLNHKHDLIHKAVGWMLREMGKKNESELRKFLNENADQMPRTTLRYAIEKFSKAERDTFLGRS